MSLDKNKGQPFLTRLQRGQSAEIQACQYLLAQGLLCLTKNYRCLQGELDLVMQDGNALVFVEVRYRRHNKYGSALESITPKKQARLVAASQHYLTQYPTDRPMRFDAVALSGDGSIQWLKNILIAGYL